MLGYNRVVVAEHERGIEWVNRVVTRILGPGVYAYWDLLGEREIRRYDLNEPRFDSKLIDTLLSNHPALCEEHFQQVTLGRNEVGLVFHNGRLADLLEPESRTLFWRGPVAVRVDVVDTAADIRIPAETARHLQRALRTQGQQAKLSRWLLTTEVADHHVGLLLLDGGLKETLGPGFHAFWSVDQSLSVEQADRRLLSIEVQGQEILTQDKVSLRINLGATYRVADPVRARTELESVEKHLYRTLQHGLRQAIGTRSLDALLSDKGALEALVFDYTQARAEPYGIALDSVGIRDVILPGEMKQILNQVVEAEKQAQANIIKRREETAATRSLLNTARLMEENPTLLRLKELETLERVAERVGSFTVYGGLDAILKDTVRIQLPAAAQG